jgi:hypothetical protein
MVSLDLTAAVLPSPRTFARDLRAPARTFEEAGRCLLLLGASPELTAELDRHAVPVITLAADAPPPEAAWSEGRMAPQRMRGASARLEPESAQSSARAGHAGWTSDPGAAVIVRNVDDDRVIEVGGIRPITAQTLVIGGGAPSYIPQEWVVELARRSRDLSSKLPLAGNRRYR